MDTEPSSETRLRHQLDVQARQINRVLSHHHVPASVIGGEVRPRVVSFNLQTQLSAGLERIRGLKGDLMSALGVGDVALSRDGSQWRLRVARPDDPPVPLLRLLASIPDLPTCATAIGLADGGRPVLLRFSAGRVGHVLIVGEPGAGKSSLLRAIGTGLALLNRQSALQLQILDPQWDGGDGPIALQSPLLPLSYLPHMLTDPALGVEPCASILRFLAEEMAYRRRERIQTPRIVALVDHLVTLLESAGDPARGDLLRLIQYGAQVGIHLVLATERPNAPALDPAIRAGMSMRIVGRLQDAETATRIAGVPLEQAPLLYGEGDFLAVTGGDVTYFQAAYVGDYDLHLKLTELYRTARPRLLARPYSARPRVKKATTDKPAAPQPFTWRDGVIDIDGEADLSESAPDESENLPF